ncbi:DUF928 domain-containing protein [Planktothrix sp. FACHB-1355]|uniref:DUF928 domain-containing protein n=1 Tax=Aerosakkonema funiforme FACHB-1375 TaxID=2949571 RepID=A0A926VBQ1_9CYAN|nr:MULTISPECIES: DUF928 domain-containing protein [Oscillatoriales]MBD2180408.1 DUF928 domain-containing protein [Aerosakkonema funiforme FACHB-1375]MBD3562847.1 DUF928 domain-containing protein [Planktothrix sp. FACHB-1355]
MSSPKNFLPLTIFSLALSSQILLSLGIAKQSQAKFIPSNENHNQLKSLIEINFDPPSDGKPSDTAGGASRSPDGKVCPQDAKANTPWIAPLMPTTTQAKTAAKHPTLFVYMPETSARKVFFTLRDETKKNIYRTMLTITGQAGIVSIKIPDEAPELETGKNYKWYFVVVCGNTVRPDSPGVEGEIRRVEPNPELNSQIQKATPVERAALYNNEGLWYDTIATVAELKRSQPQDTKITTMWEELLKSVGLEAVSKQPLLN